MDSPNINIISPPHILRPPPIIISDQPTQTGYTKTQSMFPRGTLPSLRKSEGLTSLPPITILSPASQNSRALPKIKLQHPIQGSGSILRGNILSPISSSPVTSSPFSPEETELYRAWRTLYRDPTLLLLDPVISRNNRKGHFNDPFPVPSPLNLSQDEPIKIKIQSSIIEENLPLLVSDNVINSKKYKILQTARDSYPSIIFSPEYRNLTNPFEGIGNSSFMNRAAVKLANCDAVLGIAGGAKGGLFFPMDDKILVYCDLAGAPGGFTEYIQYRFPDSYGYGMSIETDKKSLQWNTRSINMSLFNIYKGDGSGDLIVNADAMAEWILNKAPMYDKTPIAKHRRGKNVDLVLADGSIDPKGKEKTQERYNFPLLVAETLTALQILWEGGNFFIKFTNLSTEYTADLILLISNLFESTYLFKPISSRPGNSEFYLIAKGYLGIPPASKTIDLLRLVIKKHRSGETISRLLAGNYPHFWKQLKAFNDKMLVRQIKVDTAKLEILASKNSPDVINKHIPRYQVKYSLAYWNILSADPVKNLRYKSKRDTPIYI
uniref:FtsJ-like methyltransferase n=1 Tax=Pithovirus LCPAC202 TaxID=2506592 RepID=A0A481Z6M3_9VIRU|nr:MAG: FtsJ-like methyltransferase [Pithovirus LCPAC202]